MLFHQGNFRVLLELVPCFINTLTIWFMCGKSPILPVICYKACLTLTPDKCHHCRQSYLNVTFEGNVTNTTVAGKHLW